MTKFEERGRVFYKVVCDLGVVFIVIVLNVFTDVNVLYGATVLWLLDFAKQMTSLCDYPPPTDWLSNTSRTTDPADYICVR